ncbi:MAG: MFS transporter [Oligoflexales bacterium]|nr:MFS transporter [Oligoflexales bacterium]
MKTLTAFNHRNYRLWFIGQLISLFGTWMQSTAQGFLVYELTRSPAQLGIVSFAGGLPIWLFMLYGGVVADRMSKRSLLLRVQMALMAFAFILSALVFMGVVRPWHIIVLAFLSGVAIAFEAPTRQAMVSEMVCKEDIGNAIALNSTMFNTASVIGPAVGGITYSVYGPGWCFLLNGFSFLAIIVSLMMMTNMGEGNGRKNKEKVWSELMEGFAYVAREPLVRTTMIAITVMSLFGLSYVTIFPSWAAEYLHGDARTAGYMHSFRGAGAVAGALSIAFMGRISNRGRLFQMSSLIFPIVLIFFALTDNVHLSMFWLILVGGSSMFMLNMANSMIQCTVPDRLRGRVMSVYSLTFFGMMPVGGLLIGSLSDLMGERISIIACGTLVVLTALSLQFMGKIFKETVKES